MKFKNASSSVHNSGRMTGKQEVETVTGRNRNSLSSLRTTRDLARDVLKVTASVGKPNDWVS